MLLKKSAGRLFGAAKRSGTPSQLISRRPSWKEPPTLLSSPPRKLRNSAIASWMSAGADPAASKTLGAAKVIAGLISASVAAAMASHRKAALDRLAESLVLCMVISPFLNLSGVFMHLSSSAEHPGGGCPYRESVGQARPPAASGPPAVPVRS